MGENGRDWTPTERISWTTWQIAHGEVLTTKQVAESTGISWHGAQKMLCRMSRRLPILQLNGGWQAAEMAELYYVLECAKLAQAVSR